MYSVNMPTMDSVARFKAAMDSDKGALGPFMIGTDPAFVEAAGYAGYDFVLLDMEHGTTTFQTLPHLIRAANVAGVCPVVRVPRGTDIWIDQALDVGAGAIMIPQIDTAEQARAAVSAAKFSPVGTRGTCRFVRSAGFGAVPGSEYFSKAQDTVVILQAEGRKAVENLDEILDVPGVDVVFVGPYDLSSSLGHVGEIDHPEVVECIKGIIAKLHCDGPKTVYIEAAGEGEVKAGDIHADGEVEILNPDLHIATLMSDARLSMEITMTSGRGYVPAEKNKQHQTSIGVIPVDSIYTPVYKVNYTVENTRVRDLTDYDKLTLEVWTDATINARDAVSLGAKVLRDHLDLFVDLSEEIGSKSTVVEKAEAQHDKVLEMTIEELDFSVRSFNCLKRAGINTVEDLINTSEEDMMKVRNLGRKSLEEVIGKLEAMGLHLAKSEE